MKELSAELRKAQEYENKALKEENENKFPVFHLKVPTGWMNDPNGFSVYKGEYHLFFQYNPYSRDWGSMHWGHVKSQDLIRWEYLPAALAPDQQYDKEGCFSGTAIEDNGKHIIAYTSVYYEDGIEKPDKIRQTQSIAIGDGVFYVKQENNPVIDKNLLPEGASPEDFRDPKIWKSDGRYYMIIANRGQDGRGQILKFVSADLKEWNYMGLFYKPEKELGRMWECPDYFELEDTKVLIVSPQDMQAEDLKYHNGNGSLYLLGCEKEGCFCESYIDSLDYGIDFYAPQSLTSADGRRIMTAWMQSWDVNSYPEDFKWRGMMICPRELRMEEGKLKQTPVRELEKYWENEIIYKRVKVNGTAFLKGISGRVFDLTLTIRDMHCDAVEIRLAKKEQKYIRIVYDPVHEILTFDRKYMNCIRDIVNERRVVLAPKAGEITLRILMDIYSVEIFMNDGEKTLTSLFFVNEDNNEIEFIAYGGDCEIDIYKRDICRK